MSQEWRGKEAIVSVGFMGRQPWPSICIEVLYWIRKDNPEEQQSVPLLHSVCNSSRLSMSCGGSVAET